MKVQSILTGKVIEESEFRSLFNNTSFPVSFSDANIVDFGYKIYREDVQVVQYVEAVDPYQMRVQLRKLDLYDELKSLLQTLTEDEVDNWEYGLRITRDTPAINVLITTAQLTEEFVNQMFIDASTIAY